MKLVIRHIPSLFWTFLEQASVAGMSRLVLFPIVAYIVGKSEFGLFATCLSCALIIGNQPANGLATGILRNLSHYQDEKQNQLNATAVQMCHKFLLYFLSSILVVLIGLVIFGVIGKKIYLCLTLLTLSLYAENEFMLILTPLRYKRMFRESSFWYVMLSLCILLFGTIGCYLAGVIGLAFGMMSANFLMCAIVAKKYHEPDLVYDVEQARSLRWIWIHMTIAGVMVLAGPHLNRIILRIFWDNESVADLFAATGITYIVIVPLSNCSKLMLSIISKYKSVEEISPRVYKMLWGVIAGGAVIGIILFRLIAPFIFKLLFPGFGDRALDLLDILMWMIPAMVIYLSFRPLVTKFADIVWMPRINFIVLSVMLVLMFILIPRWGLEGAAWSIVGGNIVSAIMCVTVFCVVYRRSQLSIGIDAPCQLSEVNKDAVRDEVNSK